MNDEGKPAESAAPENETPPDAGVTPPTPAELQRERFAGRLENIWFSVLFLGIGALIVLMAWPFLTAIIFALIIAGSFYPLMRYFVDKCGWGRTVSASVVTTIIVLSVFLPMVYVIVRLSQEAVFAYEEFTRTTREGALMELFFGQESYVAGLGRQLFGFLNIDYNPEQVRNMLIDFAGTLTQWIYDRATSFISNIMYLLLQIFIMLLVIFGVLQRAPDLRDFFFRLSPLPEEDERLIINRFNQMNYVTMVCNGLGGILQGVLAGLALWALGFKAVILWTVIMSILAFIPLVGISFVYVPASLYLAITGNYGSAAFLFVYCSVVSLATENWFKPVFMGSSVQLNSLLVFLSIIGGMAVFGTAGIFYGPLIIIIFLTFVELYHKKYETRLN